MHIYGPEGICFDESHLWPCQSLAMNIDHNIFEHNYALVLCKYSNFDEYPVTA